MRRSQRLNKKTAIYTSQSEATVLVNYAEGSNKLEVEFTNGKVYQYMNVEPEKWEAYKECIKTGASSGEFVNKEIKPFYEFIEISE